MLTKSKVCSFESQTPCAKLKKMSTSLLLADDSPTIAKILRMALQTENYSIRSVETAANALVELQKNPPTIFLVDLALPERNGYEFSTLIKQTPSLQNVKVILLSSTFDPVDTDKVASCFADGVVEKPFDPAALRSKLNSVLSAPVRGMKKNIQLNAETGNHTKSVNLVEPTTGSTGSIERDTGSIGSIELNTGSIGSIEPSAVSTGSIELDYVEDEVAGVLDLTEMMSSSDPTAMLDLRENTIPDPAQSKTAAAPETNDLSPNAQALAAFFSAEVELKGTARQNQENSPAVPKGIAEKFDWQLPETANLDQWSSKAPSAEKPKQTATSDLPGTHPPPATSFQFDIGGSNFRFSEDYIQRISKGFTGDVDEHVPHHNQAPHHPLFPQTSNDTPAKEPPPPAPMKGKSTVSDSDAFFSPNANTNPKPTSAIPTTKPTLSTPGFKPGGGNWTPEEMQKIEQLVREEVQMVVREMVEKIAWEVIPELAENLIKKELDSVLKQIEE